MRGAAVVLLLTVAALPEEPGVDEAMRIDEAIRKGATWLQERQEKGSWGPVRTEDYYGKKSERNAFTRDELGPTAFVVHALARSGLREKDPAIRNALRFMEAETKYVADVLGAGGPIELEPQKPNRHEPRILTSYESAALILALIAVHGGDKPAPKPSKSALRPPRGSRFDKKAWRAMHDRILHLTTGRGGSVKASSRIRGTQVVLDEDRGGWAYFAGTSVADLSATHFALTALREAALQGYPVPDVWTRAADFVARCQQKEGGFAYRTGYGAPSGSLTACGLVSLLICRERLAPTKGGSPDWIDERVEKGLAWLEGNLSLEGNPGSGGHHYYYLWVLGQLGDLTGREKLGGRDWYDEGARYLLARQAPDGSWTDPTCLEPRDTLATAFAVLFLQRGNEPLAGR